MARTVSGELGIQGEKGKLWTPIWQIIRRSHVGGKRERPKVILLENVPRLLNSPVKARGLNFERIVRRLLSMGYDVEWRVINADEYGFPQKRSRVFILAYRTPGHGVYKDSMSKTNRPGHYGVKRKSVKKLEQWIKGNIENWNESNTEIGPMGTAFPCKLEIHSERSELPSPEDLIGCKKSPLDKQLCLGRAVR